MKTFLSIILYAHVFSSAYCQNAYLMTGEEIIQIDTVQISPAIPKMIFKYYRQENGYKSDDGKRFGRFEVYMFGSRTPFQKDTLDDIIGASYEDCNFDHIVDMKIETDEGASGGFLESYFFYDAGSKHFECRIGGLSDPFVDAQDSTITTEAHCCMGREGNGEVYKLIRGEFKKIKESEYSEQGSSEKQLIGDSLITTSFETISDGGEDNLVDSSWEYLYGKLRVTNVANKVALDGAPTKAQTDSGIAYEDVHGSFLYQSEVSCDYKKDGNGKLWCSYKFSQVIHDRWVVVKKGRREVKDYGSPFAPR